MQGTQNDYNHLEIEAKWNHRWYKNGVYEPDLGSARKPFYNLMMFPYPSAEGLHVGNMYAFCGSDVYGRFKRMQGNDVFEPIGLDGFGIHSENYAMKIGKHPVELSKETQINFYRQLRLVGNGFDWSCKLETYDPLYYKWTQWIFIQLFRAGLAYRSWGEVNWCPSCLTVLADEQVTGQRSTVSGQQLTVATCERCGARVERKRLAQWYFKITDYAQRLLEGLDKIDWSEKVKVAQKNWIGKSEGVEVLFSIDMDKSYTVRIFTTRVDTLFGVTFLALATDHDLVTTILKQAKGKQQRSIREFIDQSKQRLTTNAKRLMQEEKNGVFTGFYAVNPANNEKVPVYIADYILTGYGTGAVMGVPAHDQRDFEFAKKYNLEIRQVIGTEQAGDDIARRAYTDYGVLVNSGSYSGLEYKIAVQKITDDLENAGKARRAVNWHLRDWIISRQRYWGPPIPMIFCEKCAKEGKSWFTISGPVSSFPPVQGEAVHGEAASAPQPFLSQTKSNVKSKSGKGGVRAVGSPSTAATRGLVRLDWDHFGWYPVPEEDLPVELPYIKNFKPTGTGVSPLSQDPSFVRTNCPGCGAQAKREVDVSDTFLDSAWYFLRYPSVKGTGSVSSFPPVQGEAVHGEAASAPQPFLSQTKSNVKSKSGKGGVRAVGSPSTAATRNEVPWDTEITKKWLPVDMYVGGAEHSVLHLLYSRFITKAFFDLGLVHFDEPFPKFRAHGLLIHNGAKMSKSKGNVVNPDNYIAKFGADTLRTYLMFCGRFREGGDFRDEGMEGMQRFLKRVWRLVQTGVGPVAGSSHPASSAGKSSEQYKKLRLSLRALSGIPSAGVTHDMRVENLKLEPEALFMLHKTIKKVTGDIGDLSYNTAISALMEWVNFLEEKVEVKSEKPEVISQNKTINNEQLTIDEVKVLLLLLAPFAPYMTEELWQRLIVNKEFRSIHLEKWPEFDEKLAAGDKITLVVQVNGKLRGKIETERGISQEAAHKLALDLQNVSKYIKDGSGYNVVFVRDRLINFVNKSGKN